MKKTTLILTSLAIVAAASAQRIGVNVDGQRVRFEGTRPVMVNNSVLVPLRGVFEQMGAEVRWNQARQEVTANRGEKRIRLVIGERFADVDGRSVQLTTPAENRNGSTLVPLRFLSEALGAQVRWNPERMVVNVNTGDAAPFGDAHDRPMRGDGRPGRGNGRGNGTDSGRAQPLRDAPESARSERRDAVATLYKATVLPVRLNESLSSNESRRGDRFTASLDSTEGIYGQLPGGTKVEGRVVSAKKQSGSDPGLLELAFDRLVFPDGRTQDLSGTLVSLNDKDMKTDADGRIVATGKAKDNRGVYAGYGAGAGLLLGVLSGDNTKGNVTKSLIGGLLGLGAGELEKNQRQKPSNVTLKQGEKFGVRLDEDVTIYRS